MSSTVSLKPNPFTRSNPFQSKQSVTITSKPPQTPFQKSPPTYPTTYDPIHHPKPTQQLWKFHQDNINKVNAYNSQSYSRVSQRILCQKNNFQKQLVINHLSKKNNNNSGQQINQKIANPFARKYLLEGGKLVQSQVIYHDTPYDRLKSDYDSMNPGDRVNVDYENSFKYNNYVTPTVAYNYMNNPAIIISNSSNPQETSLNYNILQYASRRSQQKNGSSYYQEKNNPGQSRYSIDKEKERLYGNYQSIASTGNLYNGSRRSIEERDIVKGMIKLGEDADRVRFDSSDEEKSGHPRNYDSRQQQRAPRFGSGNNISQPKGPQSIIVNGIKFYRQNVQCF